MVLKIPIGHADDCECKLCYHWDHEIPKYKDVYKRICDYYRPLDGKQRCELASRLCDDGFKGEAEGELRQIKDDWDSLPASICHYVKMWHLSGISIRDGYGPVWF